MDRRTALQILSSGLIGPAVVNGQSPCAATSALESTAPGSYRLQFFSPEEAKFIDSVMDKIIPRDEHSPGAHDARVIEFADLMIATEGDQVKQDWHSGIHLLRDEIRNSSIDIWLEAVTQNEHHPQTVLELFYVSLKQMTINGYYSSSIGIHQDLQYQGNTYVSSFVGCHHPEHSSDS